MELKFSEVNKRWEFCASIEHKGIPKEAGFRWDKSNLVWYAPDVLTAMALIDHCYDDLPVLESQWREMNQIKAMSLSSSTLFNPPKPDGHEFYPYQKAGIEFMTLRQNTLLADEMGLGKTPQLFGFINQIKARKVLIVCPASLKENIAKEGRAWLVENLSLGVVWPNSPISILHMYDIVIINYDILHKFKEEILKINWDVFACDEAHYLRNGSSTRRGKAVFGKRSVNRSSLTGDYKWTEPPIKGERNIFMTGSPIMGDVLDLFPLISYLDPERWDSEFVFKMKYFGGKKNEFGRWEFSGSSNEKELQDRLRSSIMIRRLKDDVQKDLPSKVRQIVEISAPKATKALKEEYDLFKANAEILARLRRSIEEAKASGSNFDGMLSTYNQMKIRISGEISEARKKSAEEKLPYILDYIKMLVEEDNSRKLIVFCYHKFFFNAILEKFPGISVGINGETPVEKRQGIVDKFQTDPRTTIFAGNIVAAGVGNTLTASSHVIMAEFDFVPVNMRQAEDRAHRIGQKDTVFVQYLSLANSIDVRIAQIMKAKLEVASKVLDSNESGSASIFDDIMIDVNK